MFKYLKYVYDDNTYDEYILFREDDATLNILIRDKLRIRKNIVKIEIWDNCKCNHDVPDYSILSFNNVKKVYIYDCRMYHVFEERNVEKDVLKCVIKWYMYHSYPELMTTWYE